MKIQTDSVYERIPMSTNFYLDRVRAKKSKAVDNAKCSYLMGFIGYKYHMNGGSFICSKQYLSNATGLSIAIIKRAVAFLKMHHLIYARGAGKGNGGCWRVSINEDLIMENDAIYREHLASIAPGHAAPKNAPQGMVNWHRE